MVERLLAPLPDGCTVFYQKHMTHHMLAEVQRDWLQRLCNCFLIRDPREVALSYHKARQQVTAASWKRKKTVQAQAK